MKHSLQNLWFEFRARPMATAVGVGIIPIGVVAFVLGQGASQAFTNIGADAVIPHAMGALMVLGGLLTIAGIVRLGALAEMLGMIFIFGGSLLYGGGVIIGLGWKGSIAGGFGLIIAVGTAGRVILLVKDAEKMFKPRPK